MWVTGLGVARRSLGLLIRGALGIPLGVLAWASAGIHSRLTWTWCLSWKAEVFVF